MHFDNIFLSPQLGGWLARSGRKHFGPISAQFGQEHPVCGIEHAAADGACGHVGGAEASHHYFGVPEGPGRLHSSPGHGAVVRID